MFQFVSGSGSGLGFIPRMLTSMVAVARPQVLTASMMYVAVSPLVVLLIDSLECPGWVSMVIRSSGLRTRSALVHLTRGSGFPVTSAGSSILVPARAVRPARSFTSSWISGGSVDQWVVREVIEVVFLVPLTQQCHLIDWNLTFCIHSLNLISGPAGSTGSQFVECSDSVGVPLALNQAGHLEPEPKLKLHKNVLNTNHTFRNKFTW